MLKNMRLGFKLGIGFGIILLLTAVVAVIGLQGMQSVEDRVDKADDVNRLVRYILEVRVQEKNFMLRKDPKIIESHSEALDKLYAQTSATSDKFDQQLNKDQMAEVAKSVDIYKAAFSKYVELENQKNIAMEGMRSNARIALNEAEGLRADQKKQFAELVNTGTASQAILNDKLAKADDANRMIKWFIDARKNEKEVIISQEEKYLNLNKENLQKILALANDLKSRFRNKTNIAQLDTVIKALDEYQSEFDSFVEYITQQNKAEEVMLTSAREADEVCRDARTDQKEKMLNEISNANIVILITTGVALLLGIIVAYFLTVAITKPVMKGVGFAQSLADGDLTSTLDIQQKDEIGVLATALGDMNQKLTEIVSEVQGATDNVASGSEELSATAQTMAQGATEQASSIEEISASIEQVAANIQQNTENARTTESLATKSAKDAEEGGKAVTQTVESMKEIADKISIIEDIGRQTNLLALNAAIEAARAGEHGKGFAVVASEVRKLAEKSGQAAAEINELSSSSVEVADKAGKMIMNVIPDIQKTADLVQEIAAASIEQNTGVEQINSAVQQLDQVVQQNAAASEEMASTSEELSSQAQMLVQTMTFFTLSDSKSSARTVVQHKPLKLEAAPTAKKEAAQSDDDGVALDMDSGEDYDEFEKF